MLSPSALHELAYPVSQWMETCADRFYGDVTDALPGLWEAMIVSLRQQRGNELHRPRHSWAAEALNAPVGKLFSVVMKDPRTKGLKPGSGFPAHWKAQIDDLLNLPADLRRQALVMVGHQTTWLFTIDRAWTESWLLQLLGDEGLDGDAFWEGLLWGATLPSRGLYGLIKEALLLYAVRDRGQKGRGETTVLAGFLLAGWGSVGDDGKPLIQDEELREVLIHSSNEFRQQLIWQIERWCAEPKASWRKKVLPFFAHVWPKQRALRTPTVSRSLANFALTSGDIMPEVVELILPRLVPIRDSSLRLDAVLTGQNEALALNHSRALLDLLWAVLGEDASTWPYRAEETLDRLAQDPETAADPRLSELRRRLELRW